jgi:large subunit ribosomal protein L6
MSRIGKLPISLPKGVEVSTVGDVVKVKGAKGELFRKMNPSIQLKVEDGLITLTRESDSKEHKSLHGLYRALLANMVKGVSEGYTVKQELVGVGYRAVVTGQMLDLTLGFSHNVAVELPKEVKGEAVTERSKNPIITLTSCDKELLGMVASKIRSLRTPEPYKGKGIKFVGEELRRKAGKSAGK